MNNLIETIKGFGPGRIAIIGAVLVVVIGFLVYLTMNFGGAEDYKILYGDLNDQDSVDVVRVLGGEGIPFESRNDGRDIFVPGDLVDRGRIALAQEGVPSGGSIGYELFDETDALGSTSFVQRINRQRALEGEMQRTLGAMDSIRNARVHLVLPERELFSRDRQEARASVFVRTKNRKLTDEEVTAIQQIVAAAVPRLLPTSISVADEQGNVYATGVEDELGLASAKAENQRRNYEKHLSQSIENLINRIVGPGNVRAEVSAEMDFNRVTTNSREFDPDGQVARSVQAVEEDRESTETEGEDPVTVATNLPDANTEISTGAGSYTRESRTEETTNFEITEVNSTSVRDTAEVSALSVAVLVNYTQTPRLDAEGQTMRDAQGFTIQDLVPRPEEEMNQIIGLVQAAISAEIRSGASPEVRVEQIKFFTPLLEDPAKDLIFGLPKEDVFRIIEMLVLAIVAVLVIFLVVRPLLARALESGEEPEGLGAPGLPTRPGADGILTGPDVAGSLDETAEMEALEQMIDINQVEGRVRASSLRKIGEIVDKHPEEAVAILRNWMYQEA